MSQLTTKPGTTVHKTGITEADVRKIAKDCIPEQTVYADPNHKHTTEDITDIQNVRQGLAKEDHTHHVKHIEGVEDLIDQKISEIPKQKEIELPKSLSDLAGDLPLDRLVGGKELKELAEREWATVDHKHRDLKEEINDLRKEIQDSKKPDDYYFKAIENVHKEVKELENTIKELSKEAPHELIFNAFALVPDRAVGKKVTKIATLDFNGKKVEAKVSVKVGESLKGIISVSPSCICHVVAE